MLLHSVVLLPPSVVPSGHDGRQSPLFSLYQPHVGNSSALGQQKLRGLPRMSHPVQLGIGPHESPCNFWCVGSSRAMRTYAAGQSVGPVRT